MSGSVVTIASALAIFFTMLFQAVAAEKPAQPAAAEGQTDLRYTYELRAEAAGEPPQPPLRLTVYIKGDRQRIELQGQSTMIFQCDIAQHVVADVASGTCFAMPIRPGSAGPELGSAPGQVPTQEGTTRPSRPGERPPVRVEGELLDTGECREIFGRTARHVTGRQTIDAPPGSCEPGRQEMTTDAWLIDLPQQRLSPWTGLCPITPRSDQPIYVAPGRPGCQDVFRTSFRGDGRLLQGFLVSARWTTTEKGRTTTITFEVTDLSVGKLDESLFETPPGCGMVAAPLPPVRPPEPVPRPRPGFLVAEFQGDDARAIEQAKAMAGATRAVEFVLDASGSMWGRVAGRPKITIAREVIAQVVRDLPTGMPVGLRVYGHRLDRTDPDACTDSELVLPVGPLDPQTFIDALTAITPRGQTPLVYSVLQTRADFRGVTAGERRVVLVSDGEETCAGDFARIREAMRGAGLPIYVDVVGFALGEQDQEARKQLELIAGLTGGTYAAARDAGELSKALRQAVNVGYRVYDAAGKEVLQGAVDRSRRRLPAGTYRVVIQAAKPLEVRGVVIQPGKETRIFLRVAGGELTAEVHPPALPSRPLPGVAR